MAKETLPTIPVERIEKVIYVIRGERVMLDSDLAEIYGVSTSNFNKAVKRNMRFPVDFMFQVNAEEFESLRFHIRTSARFWILGLRILECAIATFLPHHRDDRCSSITSIHSSSV